MKGEIKYMLGFNPVTGRGVSLSKDELDKAINGPIADVVFDSTGNNALSDLLSSIAETEFEQKTVRDILSEKKIPENWRVGEALAEAYLVHNFGCFFPWPDSRDERKSGSSLPGADLIGFQGNEKDERFAFGEVKTSSELKYPPGTMHGKKGLKQQLEDLRNNLSFRKDQVMYLGFRATSATWQDKYKCAFSNYLKNKNDIRIFGILIRDVEPDKNDLEARVSQLATNCPPQMMIELLAIYLPIESISTLGIKVAQSRNRGVM